MKIIDKINKVDFLMPYDIDNQKDKEFFVSFDGHCKKNAFSIFQVVDNLDQKIMQDFLTCIRILHYEGDDIEGLAA